MNRHYPAGVVRSPRLNVSDSYEHAKISVPFFILVTGPLVAFLLLTSGSGNFYFRLLMGLMFMAPFLILFSAFLSSRPALSNLIRCRPEGPLRFLPSRLLPFFYVASVLLLLASFIPLLEVLMTHNSTIAQTPALARQFWFVTLIGGLAGVAHAIVGIFYPFGVTLDQKGIIWRSHLGRPRFVSWESVEKVDLARKGKTKVIKLDSSDEGICTIVSMTLGSDPIVIAETIDYFRRHPNDRSALNNPYEALALVVDFELAR